MFWSHNFSDHSEIISATLRLSPQMNYCHTVDAQTTVPTCMIQPCPHNLFCLLYLFIYFIYLFIYLLLFVLFKFLVHSWNFFIYSLVVTKVGQHVLKFDRTQGTHDWNYPFELCATIFRKVALFSEEMCERSSSLFTLRMMLFRIWIRSIRNMALLVLVIRIN
jgi:hypothetical protein